MWLRHPDAQEEPTELKRENDCYTNKAAEALGHSGKLKVHFKQEETCSSPREGGAWRGSRREARRTQERPAEFIHST